MTDPEKPQIPAPNVAPSPAAGKPPPAASLLRRLAHADSPLIGLGMTSVVTGLIALFLFLLPILAIPIGAFALVFGIVGLIVALVTGGPSLRWSLGGILVSILALLVTIGIDRAPGAFTPTSHHPTEFQPPRPFPAPPPARPSR